MGIWDGKGCLGEMDERGFGGLTVWTRVDEHLRGVGMAWKTKVWAMESLCHDREMSFDLSIVCLLQPH